jgi:aryl-alcohol dehydrogenase-like predicted oxidoreductase
MQYFDFEGHKLSKVFKGNWQLAGGHGQITQSEAIEGLIAYAEHGVNTFDMGDIYTGAEALFGAFLKEYKKHHGKSAAQKLRAHTKFVPDLNALEDLTKQDVRAIIERSLQRTGLEQLHLVQFHWWNYGKGDFVQAGAYLQELQKEGLIETIGLTNFDREHTDQLVQAGIPIRSNQIQFSLLDPRPLNGMLAYAQAHDIAIFCYGVLAGGLLGTSRPNDDPTNRSHIKYNLMIEEASQPYYQDVLKLLEKLAKTYNTTAANIATAYVLQTPGVSSAILGPRNMKHLSELDQLDALQLETQDYEALRTLQERLHQGNRDDIYSYERDIHGPHGKIMKYNLNGMRPALNE